MAKKQLQIVLLYGDGSVFERHDYTGSADDDAAIEHTAQERLLDSGLEVARAVLVEANDTRARAEGEDEEGRVHTSHASRGDGEQRGAPLLKERTLRDIGHVQRNAKGRLAFLPAVRAG